MATHDINNDLQVINNMQLQSNDSEYVKLVSHIATLWDNARTKAIIAVNSELLDANWQTGQYIMEYALQGIDNQLFAARYQLYLPNREELQAQLNLLLDAHQE